MAERRSLSNALSNSVPGVDANLVRSFVTQNQSGERPLAESPLAIEPVRTRAEEKPPGQDAVAAKSSRQKPKKPNRFQPVGLIPVTVRLRPEIAGALKRASLERELAGEEVFTQQAIVEEALEPWLAGAGFLD
ncbi:hypothetical protein [Gimesia maris]|uniref:hypothetical protein n=1 Tax=Gimesia maris TaxID=122 RepID=UPI003A8E487B